MNLDLDGLGLFEKALKENEKLILLYGGAGTGKSTVIKKLLSNEILTSTTGVSALKIEGVTVHSFLKIDPMIALNTVISPDSDFSSEVLSYDKFKILKEKYLVIDEFSMLRYDILNYIELKLRLTVNEYEGSKKFVPFGGLKVILVGDPFQLPPVIRKPDSLYFKKFNLPFECFKHSVISFFKKIKLTKVFRQKDIFFLNILNNLRLGKENLKSINVLNERVVESKKNVTFICLTNKEVNIINLQKVKTLKGRIFSFEAKIDGDFPVKDFPREKVVSLKKGTKIILIKNIVINGKKYYNGSSGFFLGMCKDGFPMIKFECDSDFVFLEKECWEKIDYKMQEEVLDGSKKKKIVNNINRKRKGFKRKRCRLEKVILGSFRAYPFKIGYAITVHKSQGMTLSGANVDFGKGTFVTGQVYVALSRLVSFKNLYLKRKISLKDIKISKDALTVFG